MLSDPAEKYDGIKRCVKFAWLFNSSVLNKTCRRNVIDGLKRHLYKT